MYNANNEAPPVLEGLEGRISRSEELAQSQVHRSRNGQKVEDLDECKAPVNRALLKANHTASWHPAFDIVTSDSIDKNSESFPKRVKWNRLSFGLMKSSHNAAVKKRPLSSNVDTNFKGKDRSVRPPRPKSLTRGSFSSIIKRTSSFTKRNAVTASTPEKEGSRASVSPRIKKSFSSTFGKFISSLRRSSAEETSLSAKVDGSTHLKRSRSLNAKDSVTVNEPSSPSNIETISRNRSPAIDHLRELIRISSDTSIDPSSFSQMTFSEVSTPDITEHSENDPKSVRQFMETYYERNPKTKSNSRPLAFYYSQTTSDPSYNFADADKRQHSSLYPQALEAPQNITEYLLEYDEPKPPRSIDSNCQTNQAVILKQSQFSPKILNSVSSNSPSVVSTVTKTTEESNSKLEKHLNLDHLLHNQKASDLSERLEINENVLKREKPSLIDAVATVPSPSYASQQHHHYYPNANTLGGRYITNNQTETIHANKYNDFECSTSVTRKDNNSNIEEKSGIAAYDLKQIIDLLDSTLIGLQSKLDETSSPDGFKNDDLIELDNLFLDYDTADARLHPTLHPPPIVNCTRVYQPPSRTRKRQKMMERIKRYEPIEDSILSKFFHHGCLV